MTLTKRHVDSLSQPEQDEILGIHNEEEAERDAADEPENNDWMTDKRKAGQFMHAMDVRLAHRRN